MKVAIITNIPSPYRVDLFNYLQENYRKFKFTVIYSSKSEDNRKWSINNIEKVESKFLKSFTIKIKKQNDNKYIHVTYDVLRVLNNINPDVIIASEYNPTVLQALLWCKLKGKKFISWSDGTLNSEKNINMLQGISRKKIIANSDAYIASSTKTKEAQIFYGASEKKIFTSYLTVDIKKYLYLRNSYSNKKLLYVGSLIKRKGLDLLFESLALLKIDFEFIIIGEGEELENLICLSKRLGIDKNVRFLGFKDSEELLSFYREASIFILPTREDCFGLVILEAMCNSMAVIISKHADGVYDLVKDNENGIIIDPYEKIDLKTKIEELLLDSKKIKNMCDKSYEIAQEYSFDRVADKYIEAIESILN